MKIRIILIPLLLISFLKTVNAQTDSVIIRGMVISGDTKSPIFGAVIKVENTSLGTIAESMGYFEFKIPFTEKVSLNVSYIGYASTDTIIISENHEYGFFELYLFNDCDILSKETALEDIHNKSIKLYISSGTPVYSEKQENIDIEFQKEYNIVYDDVGDALPAQYNCLEEYNIEIFNYLDKKYQNKWHFKVNKSVTGLEDYLKNKK